MMLTDSLFIAFILGVAFGFVLEQAGLADAPKLAGQFYLRDFAVLKVMFSAIVTAMLGVFWLGRFGLIDFSALYVPETFLAPQAIGGVIFGLGFVICGLCPGTGCAATGAGRIDGMATVGGLLLGVLLTGLAFPLIEPFYESTALGVRTLPQLLDAPYGMIVGIVTATALLTFHWIGRFETRS
ncbi:MAG TPA: YeeE/YedE thiosulfate transporter family protein [Steroidobacteraceae bacterium]|nr:YeeE/YedE thiosulfate transporter family protein [Steroidobacteraceae bacterium]